VICLLLKNKQYDPNLVINTLIVPKLTDNLKDKTFEELGKVRDKVFVNEYIVFVNVLSILASISKFVTVASTERGLKQADGLDAYKKERIKFYKEKYGENAFKDFAIVAQLENDLTTYDVNYFKCDPTLGITFDDKIIKISRKKRFGMLGAEEGFVKTPDAKTILEPLKDGLPKNPADIASLNNVARVGSYMRGFETRIAGESAKKMADATVGFSIVKGDCGSKRYVNFLVKKENKSSLIGLNYFDNSGKTKSITDENIDTFLDKVIKLRLPETCKKSGDNICEKCVGLNMATREGGILSAAVELGGKGLNAKMKRMHGVILKTFKLDPLNIAY